MPSPRCLARLAACSVALVACVTGVIPATNAAPREELSFSSIRPVHRDSPRAQIALTRSAAWRNFEARHGDWTVLWNEATGTPHRAFGRGVRIEGFANEPAAVDRAVRGFISANSALLGSPSELETVSSIRAGDTWYVSYRQAVRGIPLLFADWEFRVDASGKLVAFGADGFRPGPEVVTTPRIVGAVAREAAKTGLAFNPSTDRVEGGERLYLLPRDRSSGTEFRLVYDVRVITAKPRGNWVTLVDAANGEVLWRHNRVRYANITGKIRGAIHPLLPSDALVTRDLADVYVTVAATQVVTDSIGNYSATCGGNSTVATRFRGPFCNVVRLDCVPPNPVNCDASFSAGQSCPSVRNVTWDGSNSTNAERDALYHTVVAHRYVKRLDPPYNASDNDLSLRVNGLDDECLALWDGFTLDFGIGGPTCVNAATVPDIVYHEYGHRVNDDLYFYRGSTFGMVNSGLHEGLADINAAFMQDNPIMGKGLYGVGTRTRDLSVDRRWPEDENPDPNETGRILSGALWDLRQSLGLSITERLAHFAKYGLADDNSDAGIAMSEYFIEVLVADDNDANLSNGTPHFTQIVNAFNAHGIGTNYFLNIDHTPIGDQPSPNPYPIAAVIQYSGPVGSLDLSSPTVFYKVNNGSYTSLSMTPTGNPDEWGAEIPQQSASIVRYYIRATETFSGAKTDPPAAPSRNVHLFLAGASSAVTTADMESNPGWVVGAPGDSAVTGIWVRVDPIGTEAQPEDDHTPAGLLCWVTGQGDSSHHPAIDDVDACETCATGRTTLTTPTFNPTAGGVQFPVVSYFRWYSNNTGESPSRDFWKVQISNDNGTNWTTVENDSVSDRSWRRVIFFIADYLQPTTTMKLRFIASDDGDGSLIEAGVDDFSVVAFSGIVGVDDPPASRATLALAPAAPNPFHLTTRLRYTLPAAGPVNLTVYDIHGRAVRKLVTGEKAAGPYTVEWDGRDDGGRPLASGPYFLRLLQYGRKSTQAVVRIH